MNTKTLRQYAKILTVRTATVGEFQFLNTIADDMDRLRTENDELSWLLDLVGRVNVDLMKALLKSVERGKK